MKWNNSLRFRIFLAATLILSAAGRGYSFSALYAFGDSLSDTGNDPAPAGSYYAGRYSNGPLWVEYLSTNLGFIYNSNNNHAVSGSTTDDLADEIAAMPVTTNLSTGLFTVWSGGNDFLDNAGAGFNNASWNTVMTNALTNIINAVTDLYRTGAREIVVPNVPDLSELPAASSFPSSYRTYITSIIMGYDSSLTVSLNQLMQQNPGLRIYPIDIFSFFDALIASPGAYGFTTNSTDALDDPSLANKSFTGPGQYYIFWDEIHPTTKAHGLIASLAFQAVAVELVITRNGASESLQLENLTPGLPYTVQSSSNLLDWSDYQIVTPTSTNAVVAVSPGSNVFYRVQY